MPEVLRAGHGGPLAEAALRGHRAVHDSRPALQGRNLDQRQQPIAHVVETGDIVPPEEPASDLARAARVPAGRRRAQAAVREARRIHDLVEVSCHLLAHCLVGIRRHGQQQRCGPARERLRYKKHARGEDAAKDLDAQDGKDKPEDAQDERHVANGGERADERLNDELHRGHLGQEPKRPERAQRA